jgi:poly-D-alanine transfer protein DltD
MYGIEPSSPQEWQALHDELRDGLEKEIRLTRELLTNLHQEEVSLMLQDSGSLNGILQMRSEMLEKISSLRLCRVITTEKIEKMVAQKNKHPTLEEILPLNDPSSTEILSLSDQLMALTERMNRQHTQNQRIAEHGDHISYPPLQKAAESRPKRKASLATFHLKK